MSSRSFVVVYGRLQRDASDGYNSLTLLNTFCSDVTSLDTDAKGEGTDRVAAKHIPIV